MSNMLKDLKRGIKGQLILLYNDDIIKYINENIEIFKAVCDRDFEYCLFDLYEGTYEDQDVIGIDFDIRDRTVKESEASYRRFKKEILNHFGYKPKEILIFKYDKI